MQHNCELDDLGAGFEVLERGTFGHSQTLVRSLPCLKQSSSDKTALRKLGWIRRRQWSDSEDGFRAKWYPN